MLETLVHVPLVFYGVVLCMSILSASLGVGGFAMLPLFALMYGAQVGIGIITLYYLIQNLNKTAVFWKHIDWKVSKKIIPWSIVGAILGSYVLSLIPGGILNKLLGAFILFYLLNDLFDFIPARRFEGTLFPFFGVLYGFTSGLTGAGSMVKGPLFTSLGLLKERYIATHSFTAIFVNIPKIIVYFATGIITLGSFQAAIPLLFISILGTWIGKHILKQINEKVFYYVLNVVFALAALALFFS